MTQLGYHQERTFVDNGRTYPVSLILYASAFSSNIHLLSASDAGDEEQCPRPSYKPTDVGNRNAEYNEYESKKLSYCDRCSDFVAPHFATTGNRWMNKMFGVCYL
jgi:hypothetical protein